MYYPCGLLSLNAHIKELISIYILIGYYNKGKYPEFYMSYSDETWSDGPGCIFYEYSKRVRRESKILVCTVFLLKFDTSHHSYKKQLCIVA